MKIYTITCHDVYNLGASLQAYALMTYLESTGNEVRIIDYKPDYLSRHYKLWGLNNEIYDKPIIREMYNLAKLPGRLAARYGKRKREFDQFTKNYLKLTKRYNSYEELKNDPPIGDAYFAGSDQIWNTIFENGKDPAFYLNFVPNQGSKASYAASFSTEDIVEEYKEQVKKWLSNLDYISVREKSGVDIIHNLGINSAVQVLDPVFLLDQQHWCFVENDLKIKEKYILVYDFDNNPKVKEFTIDYAKRNNLKIYSIFKNDYCDQSFSENGPLDFLYLVHHAEFVVSNSFHATAFSIIFNKQFIVFNRNESINTRMQDLLSLFSLKFENNEVVRIDYDSVNQLVEENINYSKEYINVVLKGKEK